MNDMSKFNVMRWAVPDSLKHLSPHGMKVFKLENWDVLVVWFKSCILICDSINLCEPQNGDNSAGNTTVSTNILPLIGVFCVNKFVIDCEPSR
jgi:hypothetical protein